MRPAPGNEDSFKSAKTSGPIPARHSLVQQALIIATLDPHVQAIEHIAATKVRGMSVAIDAIVIADCAGRRLLDIPGTKPLLDLDEEALGLLATAELGLARLTMTRADIAREPRAANCGLVWACRHMRVTASDRVRLLASLDEETSMTLLRAGSEIRHATDPIGAVLALACQDLLEVDLQTGPLGPGTSVRRRER